MPCGCNKQKKIDAMKLKQKRKMKALRKLEEKKRRRKSTT
jgi:hypothetical protein